ncbi:imelysin family protein [Halioglobus sp. HI00S01]|uniref:imelysin family protein n=1 Tax=Halioglobus sp. HI00S01 TaxID=1822214 RepID=UPI0009EF5B62|nr:imelysin family protein [Halioglobus sp. HI00S01]
MSSILKMLQTGNSFPFPHSGRIAAAAVLSLTLSACAGGGSDGDDPVPVPGPESFDYFGVFVNLVDGYILPNYNSLADSSAELASASGRLQNYCDAIGSADESGARDDARQSWRQAMDDFQRTELHQIGPATFDAGALRLRLTTASDTNFSTCGVDQSVVLGQSADFDLTTRLNNQKGLVAVEYLLFNEDLRHTCPTQIPETADWDQRDADQRKQWRCEHAIRLATDIADASAELAAAWQIEGGNYRAEFAHPDNDEEVLGQLSDALFYIEADVKDRKLGPTLGLHSSCSQPACPNFAESPYSQTSLENIEQNLVSFRELFSGGEGLSFDDIIASEGFPEIAERMLSEVDDALNLLDTIDSSLLEQAETLVATDNAAGCANSAANPDADQSQSACALHGYLKRVTDSLRTDFVTIVNLDLPDRVQSDND